MSKDAKTFSSEELEKHNGKDLPTIYIAHEGNVFDVTGSKLWKTGSHMKRHPAGSDLTSQMAAAPHGPEILERVPRVGMLAAEKDPVDENLPGFLAALLEKVPMLRRHPHPMTIHFPMAFLFVFPLLNILALTTGNADIETTAFHMLGLGLLSLPVAMVSGPYAWWVNYGAKLSGPIRVKLIASGLLLILAVGLFAWRLGEPDVLAGDGPARWTYLLLGLLCQPLLGLLGWFGSKMTFPD